MTKDISAAADKFSDELIKFREEMGLEPAEMQQVFSMAIACIINTDKQNEIDDYFVKKMQIQVPSRYQFKNLFSPEGNFINVLETRAHAGLLEIPEYAIIDMPNDLDNSNNVLSGQAMFDALLMVKLIMEEAKKENKSLDEVDLKFVDDARRMMGGANMKKRLDKLIIEKLPGLGALYELTMGERVKKFQKPQSDKINPISRIKNEIDRNKSKPPEAIYIGEKKFDIWFIDMAEVSYQPIAHVSPRNMIFERTVASGIAYMMYQWARNNNSDFNFHATTQDLNGRSGLIITPQPKKEGAIFPYIQLSKGLEHVSDFFANQVWQKRKEGEETLFEFSVPPEYKGYWPKDQPGAAQALGSDTLLYQMAAYLAIRSGVDFTGQRPLNIEEMKKLQQAVKIGQSV